MRESLLKNLTTTIVFVILSLAIFSIDRLGLFYWPKLGLSQLTLPIQQNLFQIESKILNQLTFIANLRQTLTDHQELKIEHGKLLSENTNLKQAIKSDQILKKQLDFNILPTANLQPASVLGISRYLVLGKGQDHKIAKGDIVILENVLIGKVVISDPSSSKVLLITDPNFSTTVSVGESNIKGILKGEFGSSVIIEKILLEENVQEGDLVFTLGEAISDNFVPKGLIVGKISKIEKDQSGLFKKAVITPFFDYLQLQIVFVAKNFN